LYSFKSYLIQLGRSFRIDVMYCTHSLEAFSRDNRTQLRESTQFVLFPNSGNKFHTKKFLKDHLNMDPLNVNKIIESPSRWVMISNTNPQVVVTPDYAYMLRDIPTNDKRIKKFL